MPPESPSPPLCPYCGATALLVTGEVIYPHRRDLAEKFFWQCTPCSAYVGTHPGTQRALGTPAKKDLREARKRLHKEVINPLWESAPACGTYDDTQGDERAIKRILRAAEDRVYRFLAHKLSIPKEDPHVGMFTREQCEAARTVLDGVTYIEIRDWDKQQRGTTDVRPRGSTVQSASPVEQGPSRNRPCPCGSRRKYKQCCSPEAAAKRAP